MPSFFQLSKFTIFFAAVCLSLFQLFQGTTAELGQNIFRPVHLSWIMVLIFFTRPLLSKKQKKTILGWYVGLYFIDFLFAIMTVICGYIIASFNYNDITFLLEGLTHKQFFAGFFFLLLLLEATRRSVGLIMVLIAVFFLAYAIYGNYLPLNLASQGFSYQEIVSSQIYSTDGVFGSALAIASTVVFIYVLFGSFLQVSGAGEFFIDASFALAGKYRGGPAKASVLASATLGSISGSAIANTVTTGTLTIPMMKKLGYRPEQAAGIEAAASTGGQIMPPVMGAGAFVMAQFTGFPYSTILLISIIPAILYFSCTLLYVHLMACKLGLKGMTKVRKLSIILVEGWPFLLVLALITLLLLIGYSPVYTAIIGCFSMLTISLLIQLFAKHKWFHLLVFIIIFILAIINITLDQFKFNTIFIVAITFLLVFLITIIYNIRQKKTAYSSFFFILQGLKDGAISALPISAACATAGIVVGTVGKTGIGLQFTQFLLTLSGGHLWASLILIAIAAIILGMGLPVTAAYIVLAVMAIPTLVGEFHINLLVAHLFIFWLAQTSNVTPPVALAAFAGAGIANASPMKSAVQAVKLAQGFFLIPTMMIYSSLIYTSETSFLAVLYATLLTSCLICAFAFAIEGQFVNGRLSPFPRLLFLLAAFGVIIENSIIEVTAMLVFALLSSYYFIAFKKTNKSTRKITTRL